MIDFLSFSIPLSLRLIPCHPYCKRIKVLYMSLHRVHLGMIYQDQKQLCSNSNCLNSLFTCQITYLLLSHACDDVEIQMSMNSSFFLFCVQQYAEWRFKHLTF